MKLAVDDLALFGGPPAFAQQLHVGRPNIGDEDELLRRISDVLRSRLLTNNGRYVREFEDRVAQVTGAAHCVSVCNGTIGLQLLAKGLGLSGEVIVPSLTFIATAHAFEWLGLQPVFCDVRAETHSLDPDRIEALMTPRTTAVVGVHLWGRACEVERLEAICRKRNVALLFDAAHAFGCTHRGIPIGAFGRAEVFSFHATKFVNCFEGGAVTTNDDKLADRMRLMRDFGFADYDRVEGPGINARMSEVSAAMGLTSIESMESVVATNRRHYEQYCSELSDIPGVTVISFDGRERSNYQYVVLDVEGAWLSRDVLVQVLWAENVRARRYFYPGCHRAKPYQDRVTATHQPLPVTEILVERLMAVPTGPAIGSHDVSEICSLVRFAMAHAHEVRERAERSK